MTAAAQSLPITVRRHLDETQKAPADFPRDDTPGAVSGAQPKLLLTKIGDRFVAGMDEGEIYRRWLVCDDMVQQLVVKTTKRMKGGRVDNLDAYVDKLRQWLESQEWDGWRLTGAEARWIRDRIRHLVNEQGD